MVNEVMGTRCSNNVGGGGNSGGGEREKMILITYSRQRHRGDCSRDN